MRFVFSLIFLILLITLIISSSYAIAYLDIPIIGRGDNIQNIIFYLLENDPNEAGEVRIYYAEDVLYYGVRRLLIFLTLFWFLINVSWIVLVEFLKIDRPNIAYKYTWVWVIFFAVTVIVSSYSTYYYLYDQRQIPEYVGGNQIIYIVSIMVILSSFFQYLCSLFMTSRVMRPAVPLANIIMRF